MLRARRFPHQVLLVTLSLASSMTATQAELKPGPASSVGMSEEALARAASILEAVISEGQITAASLLVARKKTVVLSRGFGRLSPEQGSPPVEPDSIFLLASIT